MKSKELKKLINKIHEEALRVEKGKLTKKPKLGAVYARIRAAASAQFAGNNPETGLTHYQRERSRKEAADILRFKRPARTSK